MAQQTRLHKLSDCRIFFDFDNTITPFDVLDDIIQRFSVNKDWMKWEKRWKAGKIGSRECLKRQLGSVRITKEGLSRYLSRVKLVTYFNKLINLLKREGIKPIILSDSFSFVIKSFLNTNGFKGIKIYSNRVRFDGNRLLPSFPYANRRCSRCAHCKRKHLLENSLKDKIIIYVGDGRSDICPAQEADIVFAKGELLKYFRKKNKLCVAFDDFRGIYDYLRRLDR
jgi:2,3-diketo-5-methylthio-1-phosphopentane phosphatase